MVNFLQDNFLIDKGNNMKKSSSKAIGILALMASVAIPGVASAGANVLAGKSGMTVYTFDNDTAKSGKSTCFDDCAGTWPPVPANEAPSSAGEFGKIERPDGFQQLTINGMPLYFFAGDQGAGQTSGDNLGKVWHVVRVAPQVAGAATKKAKSGYSY